MSETTYKGWTITTYEQAVLRSPSGLFNPPFVSVSRKFDRSGNRITMFNVEGRTAEDAIKAAKDQIDHRSMG